MAYPRRFPAPWRVEERDECYIVVDGAGQKLAHLYFEDEPIRQGILKRLGKDDAWRIARAFRRCCAGIKARAGTTAARFCSLSLLCSCAKRLATRHARSGASRRDRE